MLNTHCTERCALSDSKWQMMCFTTRYPNCTAHHLQHCVTAWHNSSGFVTRLQVVKHTTYLPSIYYIDLSAGYLGIVKKACEAKGCCWLPLLDLEQPLRGGPQLEQPACFYTNTAPSLYQATDVNRTKKHTEVSRFFAPGAIQNFFLQYMSRSGILIVQLPVLPAAAVHVLSELTSCTHVAPD
jgi:hypothetical protein